MALFQKAKRTMLQNKAQYLGALLMIIISCMLFVTMNMVSINLDHTFKAFSERNVLGDAEFYVESVLNADEIQNKFDAKIEKSGVLDYELSPGQTLRIFSQNELVNLPAVIDGQPLKGSDILIDELFANANGISIGDSLVIAGKSYKVAGYMVLPNYIYIIKSKAEMINDPKTFGIAVLGKDDFSNVPGGQSFYSIKFNNENNIRTQEAAVKNYLKEQGVRIQSWESTDHNSKVTMVDVEVQTLSTMSKFVPTLILILTCVLTGVLMRRMISRESVIIGTLYAQGYKKSELWKHYLTYPLSIAGIGGILGTFIGVLLIKPMFDFLLTVFTMPVESMNYDFKFIVISIIAPALILCINTFFVVNKVLSHPPAVLMKGGKTNDKSNFIEGSLKLDRFRFDTKFKIREQVRSLSRTAFLLLGIVVATMFLLYGLTMKSSLDYLLTEGFSSLYNLKYEYVYHNQRTGTPPEGTEPFGAMYVTLAADEDISFILTGVLPDSNRVFLKDISGKQLRPDKMIMTVPLANKMGVKAGDTIKVFSDEDLKEYNLTIDAVANTYAGEFIFMPLEQLNKMQGLPNDSYIGIWSDQSMDFPKGEIKSMKSMDAIVAGFNSLIDQVGIMIYGLTILAFVLGLIIIFIVTGLVVEENKNSISLMKIFGYRKREINRLILNSNTATVVAGYILGIPVLFMSVRALMQRLTASMQLIIPVKMNGLYIALGFVVVMATFELAKMASRKKINAISMSEALKSGNE